MIADDEFNTKSQEIRVAIAEAEKAIVSTYLILLKISLSETNPISSGFLPFHSYRRSQKRLNVSGLVLGR